METSKITKKNKTEIVNFRKKNLRGQSFKGKNLAEADFSKAHIQGADFSNAILRDAKFVGTIAGLQERWAIVLVIVLLVLSTLSGFPLALASWWLPYFFLPETVQEYTHLPGVLVLGMLLILLYFLTTQVLEIALGSVAAFGTAAVAGAGFVIVTMSPHLGVGLGVCMAAAAAAAAAASVAGAAAITAAAIGAGRTSALVVVIGSIAAAAAAAAAASVAIATSGTIATSTAMKASAAGDIGTLMAGAGAGASIFLSSYISWYTLNGDEKYRLVLKIAIALAAIKGTSFRGADLTNVNFTGATLKSTKFNHSRQNRTIVTHACWLNAKDLKFARVEDSILINPAVQDLLISNSGEKRSYQDADLSGANLRKAKLNKANLKRANLSGATLEEADLFKANLTEVLAIGTDFTEAHLTGVCLEGWNIDHTTKLKDVDCKYFYLLEKDNQLGGRERRPHTPEEIYSKGDFEKILKETINVVQILLRNGINKSAFYEAFVILMKENSDITPESIIGLEKKGEDILLTLSVSELTDKGKIERFFLKEYKKLIKQLEIRKIKYKQLEGKNEKVEENLRKEQAENKKLLLDLVHVPKYIGNNMVVNETNETQNFRDFTIQASENAVVSLREISGNVTNTINKLKEKEPLESEVNSLANLLTQLQTAIESENSGLNEKEKKKALKHLNNLGKLGNNQKGSNFRDRAEDALDALPTILNRGSGLLKFIKEHFDSSPEEMLKIITKILGF